MNLTRFAAKGTLPKNVERRIAAHAAVPIQPETNTERAVGWCQHGDELNLHPAWNYNNIVLMDLRIETLKPAGKDLKRLVRQRVAELEAELKEPLPKFRKIEIRDVLKMDLRKKIPSKISTVPVLWDLARNRVYLYTQSQSVIDSFLLVFGQTFEVPTDIEGTLAWNDKADLHTAPKFLTWLFYKSSQNNGEWMLPGLDRFVVQMGEKFLLGHGEAVAAFNGDADQARRAIAEGYSVRELPLCIFIGDKLWMGTLNTALQWKGVKLPTILGETPEETAMETSELLAELDGMLRGMFAAFLENAIDENAIINWSKADRT
ncbi:MAG TPA: recombination-associated protein RdgC [Thauera aminoaromatica]|nr:recombination-associated protein RdgC [Thauera aminoaromatica]